MDILELARAEMDSCGDAVQLQALQAGYLSCVSREVTRDALALSVGAKTLDESLL